MKFSLSILLICLFICPILFESCREFPPYPYDVVTSGFEGEYTISYSQSYMDSRCSSEVQTFSKGSCYFSVSSYGDNGIGINADGCEWWPLPDIIKYISGEFDKDGNFQTDALIACFMCCCEFEMSGRFYSDKTMVGEVHLNFTNDYQCSTNITFKGIRKNVDQCELPVIVAPYEEPESDNECIDDSDCLTSGCSGEVCSPESVNTICIYRPPPSGCQCGCVSGRCKWHYF